MELVIVAKIENLIRYINNKVNRVSRKTPRSGVCNFYPSLHLQERLFNSAEDLKVRKHVIIT
jgi:hypothetical protein